MGLIKKAMIGGAAYYAYNEYKKNKTTQQTGQQYQQQVQQQNPQQPQYSQNNGSQRDMSEYDQRIPEQYFNVQPKGDQKQIPPQYQQQQSYAPQYPSEKSTRQYSE